MDSGGFPFNNPTHSPMHACLRLRAVLYREQKRIVAQCHRRILLQLGKALGLVLAVGSGLSVGKEGPFVHVCMCVAALWTPFFSKFRDNEGRKRELLSCAAGAGVAVAFGAPLGGVLFALEEVSTYFPRKTMWRSFWCAISAVLAMQGLNRNGSGKLVMFEVHYHHQWKWFEILPFMALGAAGGLAGAAFVRMHAAALRFRMSTSSLSARPIAEAAAVATLTSLISWGSVYLRGSSTSLLGALFADCAKFPAGAVRDALCSDADHVTTELLTAAGLHLLLSAWTSTAVRPSFPPRQPWPCHVPAALAKPHQIIQRAPLHRR